MVHKRGKEYVVVERLGLNPVLHEQLHIVGLRGMNGAHPVPMNAGTHANR